MLNSLLRILDGINGRIRLKVGFDDRVLLGLVVDEDLVLHRQGLMLLSLLLFVHRFAGLRAGRGPVLGPPDHCLFASTWGSSVR